MKERLDVLVTKKGIAPSRERGRALIMEGKIFVDGIREDKPGTKVAENADIELRGETLKYVSRGGLKLEKAIDVFPISLEGYTCMDVGSSTGGFTDCMLQYGAAKVYSVDSGRGQLAWSLRTDERVVCMERTNFRYITAEDIPEPIDFASADVSFISLKKILPAAYPLLKEGAGTVCLIKPQFEAGREEVGKKGVVRDPVIHKRVIREVSDEAVKIGFSVHGLDYSPIKGPEGNIEYLVYLVKGEAGSELTDDHIAAIVDDAHRSL